MYPLGLSASERKLFRAALRGDASDPLGDPDVPDDLPDPTPDPPDSGGDPPVDPGDPDPGTASPMRFVTANVRHGMSVQFKREDMAKVAGLGSIIMWQEFGNSESQRLVEEVLPKSAWHHLPAGTKPTDRMSLKKSIWDVEQSANYPMNPRPPGHPRGQAATGVTVALVTSKTGGIQFLVVGTHFVAHAWCNHPKPDKQWLKDAWGKHYNRMQALVLDARSRGLTVIGGGDWNRNDVAKFHASQDWFRHPHYDYLFGLHASGGATYNMTANQAVSLHSDHDAQVATLTWTAGSNPIKHSYNWSGA